MPLAKADNSYAPVVTAAKPRGLKREAGSTAATPLSRPAQKRLQLGSTAAEEDAAGDVIENDLVAILF